MRRLFRWLKEWHTEEFAFPNWVWVIILFLIARYTIESVVAVAEWIWGLR